MALTALRAYPVDPVRVRSLSVVSNGIFRVDTAKGERLVLRIHDPKGCHGPEETAAEMAWLDALARETDLGIPRPVATRAGELSIATEAPGVPEPRSCQIFGWIPGPDLADRMTPDNVRLLGGLAAALHRHAAGFRLPAGCRVRTMDRVLYYGTPGFRHLEPDRLFAPGYEALIHGERREIIRAALERAEAAFAGLLRDPGAFRVIHNDLHPWNVKVSRGGIHALDFEDLAIGHPLEDIAVTFHYLQDREDGPALREAFRSGYEALLPWPAPHPDPIPALVAGRGLMLINHILGARKPDEKALLPGFLERMDRRLRRFLSGGG